MLIAISGIIIDGRPEYDEITNKISIIPDSESLVVLEQNLDLRLELGAGIMGKNSNITGVGRFFGDVFVFREYLIS